MASSHWRALPPFLICLVLAPATSRAEDATIVAHAGAVSISEARMRDFLAGLPAENRAAFADHPKQAAQWLSGKVLDLLVLDDAAKAGFDKRPAVEQQLARARDALLIQLYLDAHVTTPPDYPSETEARAYYDANKSAFIPPKRYRLAQIFIADASDAKSNAKAEEAWSKVKAKGANFALIAHALSDNKEEAAKSGEIGWLGEPALAPEIRAALTRANKGDIPAPIRMKDGFHIVRVLDEVPAAKAPLAFELVKDTLSGEMRRRKIAADRQAFVETLLKANPISLDEGALAEAIKPAK